MTAIGVENTQTYLICAGSLAAVASALLVLSQLRNARLRAAQRKSEQNTAAHLASLEKASAARNNFLTALSHEIRNPLNGITGLAESMNASHLDQKSRQKLELLRQCSTHLASLLDDVLDFSKVQPEPFKFNPQAFDLEELMNSVIALASVESEKRGIPVEIALSPSVPRQLVGDPLRIRQILLNYVYNALKYSSRGKICVAAWQNKMSGDSVEIFFAVSDEGPGISVEEQTRLFAPLESEEGAGSLHTHRKTLGLSICKTLAEKRAGRCGWKANQAKARSFTSKRYSRWRAKLDRWPVPRRCAHRKIIKPLW